MSQPGEAIGRYQILRELGRGGMGVVYEARHPELPRTVALKVIPAQLASLDGLERFEREAHTLARVRHPNVVRVHDLGRSPQGPYLVTELLEGRSLEEVCAGSPLRFDQAARIVRDLAGALEAIHAAGCLHRDLKPDNVILRPDGSPVLLDFGLARDVSAQTLTQTGEVLGTPSYMSPEQANGESPSSLDARTDVYGLGAILFHLLSGRPPFQAATSLGTLQQVLLGEPRWPSWDGEGAPFELVSVCQVAMAKSREHRYASPAALKADLERFLNDERVLARPPSAHGRHLLPIALGSLALLAGAVAWAVAGDPTPLPPTAAPGTETATPTTPAKSGPPPQTPRPQRRTSEPLLVIDEGGKRALRGAFLDDRHVVIGHDSKSRTRVWVQNLESEAVLWSAKLTSPLHNLAVRRHGSRRTLVAAFGHVTGSADARRLAVFRSPLSSAQHLLIGPRMDTPSPYVMIVTPDGRRLFSGGDWVRALALQRPFGPPLGFQVKTSIGALALSPDGQVLVAGSCKDLQNVRKFARLEFRDPQTLQPRPEPRWTRLTQRLERELRGDMAVTDLAFSPSGHILVVATYAKRILLYDLRAKTVRALLGSQRKRSDEFLKRAPRAHAQPVRGVRFLREDLLISVSGGGSDQPDDGEVRLWRLPQGEELLVRPIPGSPFTLDLSPDRSKFLVNMRRGRGLVYWVPKP